MNNSIVDGMTRIQRDLLGIMSELRKKIISYKLKQVGELSLLQPNRLHMYSIILLLPYCYYIKVSDTRVICVALLYIQPSPAYNTLRYYFVFV